MRRHEQDHLIDDTPLGLWGNEGADPEDKLRRRCASQGVPLEQQRAMLQEITTKAAPGAKVGPFIIGQGLEPKPRLPPEKLEEVPTCLCCSKPAVVLVPGRAPVFCSTTCRGRWQRSIEAWNRRLAKTKLVGEQSKLFEGLR